MSVDPSAGPTPCSSDASAGPTLTAPRKPSADPAPRMAAHGRITVQTASRREAPRGQPDRELAPPRGHVSRREAIDANHREQQRQPRKRRRNLRGEAGHRPAFFQLLRHATHPVRGQARHCRAKATRQRRDDRARITLCANDQVSAPYGELIDRHIQRGTVGFAARRDIAHDADNRHGVIDERRRQTRAQGLTSTEQVSHESPVDDGHTGRELGIRADEPTASGYGNPHSIEVGGTDGPQGGRRIELAFTQHAHRRTQPCHLRGQPHRHRDAWTPGNGLALRDQLAKQLSCVPVECSAQVQVDGDELIRCESVVERDEVLQAAGQQYLRRWSGRRRSRSAREPERGGRSAVGVVRCHPTRFSAEASARRERRRAGARPTARPVSMVAAIPTPTNPTVQGNLRQPRDTHRRHRDEDGQRPASEQQAQRATRQREDQAFGNQLSEHARAGRTERATDRHLSGTVRAARSHQRGNVRTGDEQRQHRCSEERLKRCAHVGDIRSLCDRRPTRSARHVDSDLRQRRELRARALDRRLASKPSRSCSARGRCLRVRSPSTAATPRLRSGSHDAKA